MTETVQFWMLDKTLYESNENSILDMLRNPYIAFGHSGGCYVEIEAPAMTSAKGYMCYSQQIWAFGDTRQSLPCFKFRILRGPLIPVQSAMRALNGASQ
jgi:hypothetical protein